MECTAVLASQRGPQPVRADAATDGAIDAAYDAWKAAEAASRGLESEVRESWRQQERGQGAGPSKVLLRELACLRQEARDNLRHAIWLLRQAGYIQPAATGGSRARFSSVVA